MSYTVTFFSGTDTNGREAIWETNGTAAGTFEVAPLFGTSNKPYGNFTQAGSRVLFAGPGANGLTDLWVTDGTTGGTYELDIPSASHSLSLSPADLASLGSKVLFNGIDASGKFALWVSDGTVAGTQEIVSTAGIDPRGMTAYNGKVLFGAIVGGGLWVSDGTAGGTAEIAGTSTLAPEELTVFSGKAYFIDGKTGNLGVTDGTAAGTHILLGLGDVVDLTAVGASMFFEATDTNGKVDLFKTDGTAAGTVEVPGTTGIFNTLVSASKDGPTISPDFAVLNGKVYFEAASVSGGFGLWVSDGTAGGTHEITGIAGTLAAGIFPSPGDPDFNGPAFAVINNKLVFDGASPGSLAPSFGQTDLWVSDGTAAGTHELTGIPGGGYSSTLGLDASNMTTLSLPAQPSISGILFASSPDEVSSGFVDMTGSAAAALSNIKIYNGNTLLGAATRNLSSFDFFGQLAPGTYSNLRATGINSTGQTVSQNAPFSLVTGVTGQPYTDVVNLLDPSGALTGQIYYSQGNVYLQDTIAKLSNGYLDYHYAGGSYFGVQSFGSFDNIYNPSGTLISQLIFDKFNAPIQDILYNGNGSIFLKATITTLGNGNLDFHFASGSYFTGQPFAVVDDIESPSGALLAQTRSRSDGSRYVLPQNDFNGNGTSDILWQQTGGAVYDWGMSGGQHTATTTLAPPGTLPTSQWTLIGTGDFNDDATTDLLWQNKAGATYEWDLSNGVKSGDVTLGTLPPSQYKLIATGDFNGDGTDDLLWQDQQNGAVYDWGMTGGQHTGNLTVAGAGALPLSAWAMIGKGDFNGDGTTDLLWQSKQSGAVYEWTMTGGQHTGDVSLGTLPLSQYALIGTGDCNGDGTADLLWQDKGTGAVYEWGMVGGQHATNISLGTLPTSQWSLLTTGDFDGNGTSDLLWQSKQTGALYTWGMTGGQHTSDSSLGMLSTSDWHTLSSLKT